MNEEFGSANERSARIAVIRDAAIYTPLFVAGIVLTVLSAMKVVDSGPILTVIEAIITVLFGYQSIQALRDLSAEVVRTEGIVGRRWSKMDFIITRSHYIAVGGKIFRVPVRDWHLVDENDRVVVTHYPHSGTVAGVDHLPDLQGKRSEAGV
ncbi:MAG TPA: hypothetical protein VK821_03530 [Dehalococcoidia bacterium]|nr:hypothetical protein [Dehalococcoidia bacterium]